MSRFSVENFLSPRVENIRSGILYCFINLGYRKSLDKTGGRGSFEIFRRIFFCLTAPENFVGNHLVFQKFSDSEKFHASEGYVTIFCGKIIVLHYRNISKRNLFVLCIRKFPVVKKFLDNRGCGVSRYSVENFLSHKVEKFRKGILYCFINLGYRKSLN